MQLPFINEVFYVSKNCMVRYNLTFHRLQVKFKTAQGTFATNAQLVDLEEMVFGVLLLWTCWEGRPH